MVLISKPVSEVITGMSLENFIEISKAPRFGLAIKLENNLFRSHKIFEKLFFPLFKNS
jgi:hypothetical protein